jgi:hypothetical protein
VADEERRDAGQVGEEPVYEALGPGWNSGTPGIGDDADWAPQPAGPARAALSLAVSDWRRTVGTVRFWLVAAAVPLVTFLAAWFFVAVAPAEDLEQADALFWAYLVAAALMPATSSFLALHWAMAGVRRFPGHRAPPSPDPGPVAAFFAVTARGLAVGAIALFLLLVLAGPAGVPGTLAATAVGVIVLEFAVFGAIGAGASAVFRRRWWGAVAGWTVGVVLVVGNVAAVWALWPAVRAEEPVAVAMNVEWGPGGTREAYDCAPELTRTAEVFHTERIVWLMAANPTVMFLMLMGRSVADDEGLGWIPGSFQEAADGTQVPCVNAEPRVKNASGMPLELIGLATQGALAGAFLAGGQFAARRRSASGG